MLSVFATTELIPEVKEIIQLEERLSELVHVYDLEAAPAEKVSASLVIDQRGILIPIDWQNLRPPYLLPSPHLLKANNLLGLVFYQLGNTEKAWAFLQDQPSLLFELDTMLRLQYGYLIKQEELQTIESVANHSEGFDQYRLFHNLAVIKQYGYLDFNPGFQDLEGCYQEALEQAPHVEFQAFTTKHYATLLIDLEQIETAIKLLEKGIQQALSQAAQMNLKALLANAWMKQLVVPYDEELLKQLKDTLWEVLQYFETHEQQAEAGMVLIDAAHIANISDSFSEALGYLSKAIQMFEMEELPELAAHAHLKKGTLLFTWAQKGNPQFYKPAIESYQEALKVFKKEETPDVFADIHHNLAIIYSEMPADPKKRSIWAGVASASFQEALNFYTKEQAPYEYGMISNNFGNALSKFPPAIHSDNYEKALFYYEEALNVRTSEFPYERAITILNFLEASWKVSNAAESFNEDRYQQMLNRAKEVADLVDEEEMIAEAQKHLDLLAALKNKVSNT